MKIGMTLPILMPDIDGPTLEAWSRAIDEGPFASVCFGERVAFDNPETLTLLGAVAAWTKRARIVTTVVVPQLHNPVMLAKALATGDLLSQGRLSVGVGVGGREEDYRAIGADPATKTIADLADRMGVLKRIWAGEYRTETVLPVGPPPAQAGGPELLVGTSGPRTIRSAAQWADGLTGMSMDLNPATTAAAFDLARAAWSEAGRPAPRLTTSFWFALDDGDGSARQQVADHIRHYMNWIPAAAVEAVAHSAGFAGTAAELRDVLSRFADIGTDELHLIPTSHDVNELAAVAELLA